MFELASKVEEWPSHLHHRMCGFGSGARGGGWWRCLIRPFDPPGGACGSMADWWHREDGIRKNRSIRFQHIGGLRKGLDVGDVCPCDSGHIRSVSREGHAFDVGRGSDARHGPFRAWNRVRTLAGLASRGARGKHTVVNSGSGDRRRVVDTGMADHADRDDDRGLLSGLPGQRSQYGR